MAVETASQATPPAGSLEEAQQAFSSLLTPPKERAPRGTKEPPPEQRPSPDAEQARPAPETEEETPEVPESEAEADEESSAPEGAEAEAQADDEPDAEAPAVRLIPVKLPDGVKELPESEVAAGYLRTQDYTRKTMELADARRKFEQEELPAVRAERQHYGTLLGQLEQTLQTLVGEPDWDALKATMSPDQWQQAWIAHQQDREKLAQVRQERERVMALEAHAAQRETLARLAEERQKLQAALPEFADPVKAEQMGKALTDYALSQGFTPQEAQVSDHRLVVLLHKAMQFDRVRAKAPTPQNRVERTIRSVAPGTGPARRAPNKRAQAEARLRQSGSLDDAAAALAEIIE